MALGKGLRRYIISLDYPPPEKAMTLFHLQPGFEVSLFAAEPMLVNPVCFCFDEQGRVYLVETQTFHYEVDYSDEQIACRTFEESEAIRVRDLAEKPHLTGKSERVRLLEDRTGHGRADVAETFAGDFPLSDGVAAGIVARDGHVWLANAPNLWHYQTENGRVVAKEILLHGFGVRRANLGHDLHGLIFGPDGKLYIGMGDRGLHVRTKEGQLIDLPDTGSVLRCNPDGSALEVFAVGLRNVQRIAFDRFGNLFGADNDANRGDRTRWLYITEGSDAGWQIGFQMMPNAGLWNSERLWDPDGNCPPYCLPSCSHLGRGPAGLAYYPGTGLPHEFDDHFFFCNFPAEVWSFAVRPRGAGFERLEAQKFIDPIWATDVNFGLDGGVYVSDWVFHFDLSQMGRIYRISHPVARADPMVAETRKIISEGMAKRSDTELAALLGHRDMRVRQKAQFALADRGPEVVGMLTEALMSSRPQMARIHAVWALGQIAHADSKAVAPLIPIMDDADEEVRAQAARILGDSRCGVAYDGLIARLADSSPRVRYFAAMGLGKLARKEAVEPVLHMLRENADRDAYLRHAGVMALAGIGDIDALIRAGRDASVSARLAALLAMRRLANPAIARFLEDPDAALVLEAARAIHDVPITAAMPALAALADPARFPAAAGSRVVNANYRLGSAAPLARLAASVQAPLLARLLALQALAEWDQCTGKDRVLGNWRPVPRRNRQAAAASLRPIIPHLLKAGSGQLGAAAAQTAAALGIGEVAGELAAFVQDPRAEPQQRAEALLALAQLADAPLGSAVSLALSCPDEPVRRVAVRLIPKAQIPEAPQRLRQFLKSEQPVTIRQAAIAALSELYGKDADAMLETLLDQALAGQLPASLTLDLLEAAGKRSDAAVVERLARLEAARPKGEPLAAWWETLEGGDATAGRQVFFEHAGVSCLRCHKIGSVGGDVGPALSSIGAKQSRRYLLEAIVLPNAVIAQGYAQTTLLLKNGKVLLGRIEDQSGDGLVLLLPDGQRQRIARGDIESRKDAGSAMPEGMAKLLTKRQLRDLVEYLASLREQ
jgi:quinoprotein glucose dehydrogenase